MEQQIEPIRAEMRAIMAGLAAWEDPASDRQGYYHALGYLRGLSRAIRLLKGSAPWDWDDFSDWCALHLDRDAE